MRKISVGFVLFLVAVLAQAGDIHAVRKAIDQKEREFEKAMKAKDISWFQNSSTSDLKEVSKNKSYSKAEIMSQMRQMFAAELSVQKISTTITSIKIVGKNAVAVTESEFEASIQGPNGKPGKLVVRSTQQETWVPVGKDWKVKEIRTISETDTLNGKKFGG